MSPHTIARPPARVELPGTSDDKYTVSSALEIESILRRLRERNVWLAAYPASGTDFFVTALLEVAPNGSLVIDRAPDDALSTRAASGAPLVFVTNDERVQIQFTCRHATTTLHGGMPALRCPQPERLLRLQRRDDYRIMTPVLDPLRCVIQRVCDGNPRPVELRILDISCGGIAAASYNGDIPLDHGTHYPCTIELRGAGTLHATIALRNVFEVTLPNGTRMKRAGCQFAALSGQTLALIQRYILQQQRAGRIRTGRPR